MKIQNFEPMAKVLAANAISQTLSFCLERKYLSGIADSRSGSFSLQPSKAAQGHKVPQWLKIEQVGRPLKDSAEECFTAIQKILAACFIPKQLQLIFLVNSIGGVASLYLGIRPMAPEIENGFADDLQNFIKGIWPGLQSRPVIDKDLKEINDKISGKSKDKYRSIVSLTGVPSMESQYSTLYPATIDKLIAGMHGKDFSYMVVAEPISEQEIDSMLYQCRDMNGQVESVKSFNFSESASEGANYSYSFAKSTSETVTESISQEKKERGYLTAGIVLASTLCPPAAAIVGPLLELNDGIAQLTGVSLLAGFAPSKTHQHSVAKTTGTTETDTFGYSTNQSKSISQNIVSKHVESSCEHLSFHTKRFETGKAIGCWDVGVYLMGDVASETQMASLQLKSILSGQESVYEPVRVHDLTQVVNINAFSDFRILDIEVCLNGNIFNHPLGQHFNKMTTVLNTKELSYLINFPLRSVPGISVIDSAPEFSLNQLEVNNDEECIDFGHLLYGGSKTEISYKIPIDALAKHTLLSGINGTGKTNTVEAVLNAIIQSKKHIPFLVIEPAKTEYVDWALKYNEKNPDNQIKIFMPGCKEYRSRESGKTQKIDTLKLNPFEIVWLEEKQNPNVLTHIDRLKSTFASAFPMYDILPVLMEDLIYTLYQEKTTDWMRKEPKFRHTLPPTLTGMALIINKVIDKLNYEQRVADNMKACLNTRISSLRRGWKKEMLDTLYSTPWDELFEKPCIINLSYVGDDVDKSFFMSLILQFLYEYRTAQADLGMIDFNANSCRHLTVIEEAHRVMQKCDRPEEPQYKTAMMFSNMLSEIRAYGEGLFLVDQVPTRLIPDAIKNTNTKITHRLVAEDDCRAISESMGISDNQKPIIPKLLVGQCLISTALSTEKHWVKVNKVK